MTKQSFVIPGLIVLVLIYNMVTLPIQTNVLSALAAVAIFGVTGSNVLAFFTLIATPIVVYALPRKEGFHNDGAKQISERVKQMKGSGGSGKVTGPTAVTGVLERPDIDSFMNVREMFKDASGVATFVDASGVAHFVDASGNMKEEFQDASGVSSFVDASGVEEMGAPGVSVPAYVRQQGRMLVVPEFSMPPIASIERNPKMNPYVPTYDSEGMESALASDATQLPPAEETAGDRPGVSVGPRRVA